MRFLHEIKKLSPEKILEDDQYFNAFDDVTYNVDKRIKSGKNKLELGIIGQALSLDDSTAYLSDGEIPISNELEAK
jgi:hypothetical protein